MARAAGQAPNPALARFTSVPFAVALIAVLAAWAAWRPIEPWKLLAAACLPMLAVAWTRRPYDRARAGFLLVHAGPVLVLAGLASGTPWAAGPGRAALALGLPWMFYLKPLLKPKSKAPAPAWQRLVLHGTRLLAMAALALLLRAAWRGAPPPRWALASFLVLALALHIHHLMAWKGRNAQLAGLAAWGLGLAAYLGLR